MENTLKSYYNSGFEGFSSFLMSDIKTCHSLGAGNWKPRISTQSCISAWLIPLLLKHLRTAHTGTKAEGGCLSARIIWSIILPSSPLQPPEQWCPRVQRVGSRSAQGQALTHFTLFLKIFITAAFIASSHSYILAEEGRELERSCDRN